MKKNNMDIAVFIILLFCLFGVINCHNSPKFKPDNIPDFKFSKFLDKDRTFHMKWTSNSTHAIIELAVKTLGWVGLGLSPHGGMHEADIVVAWMNYGHIFVEDRYATGNSEPIKDDQQDWTAIYGRENETHTTIGLTRLLDTCDIKHDRPFTSDTLYVIYAYHSQDIVNGMMPKHEVRGTITIFFYEPIPEFVIPEYTKKIQLRMKEKLIREDKETEYVCQVMPLKGIDKKYHIVATGPIKTPGNEPFLHHIDLYMCSPGFSVETQQFACSEPSTLYIKAKCFHSIMVAWSLGAEGYLYPENIGKPIEPALENRMVLLEIHYNNPNKVKGKVDTSGLELYLTDKLRKQEAGELILGFLEYSWNMIIPPKQKEFRIVTECHAMCTGMNFPVTGIHVFAYILHTHQIGKRLRVRIIRDGKEMKPVIFDNHFKFDYQAKRRLSTPITLYPGDVLLAECDYSTEDLENYVIGGESSADEMCIIVLSYYPKMDLQTCGSKTHKNEIASILGIDSSKKTQMSTQYIQDFLNKEEQKVDHLPTIASKLQDLYNNGSTEVSCIYNIGGDKEMDADLMTYKAYLQESSKCEVLESKAVVPSPPVLVVQTSPSRSSANSLITCCSKVFLVLTFFYIAIM